MSDRQQRDIEQQLRERINRLVDEALGSAETDKPLSLSDIEDIALVVRVQVGQAVAQALVQRQGTVGVPGPTCEQCGRAMHDKGLKKRRMVSRSGEVDGGNGLTTTANPVGAAFPPRMKRLG